MLLPGILSVLSNLVLEILVCVFYKKIYSLWISLHLFLHYSYLIRTECVQLLWRVDMVYLNICLMFQGICSKLF